MDYTSYIQASTSFEAYLSTVKRLFDQGRVTGSKQSEGLYKATQLNLQRMKRWLKMGELLPAVEEHLKKLTQKETWLVISEGWCGDAAHVLPFFKLMESANPEQIALRVVLRDEHPQLIENHQTNGTLSIPIVLRFVGNEEQPRAVWGPRPVFGQQLLELYKNEVPFNKPAFLEELQGLYNKDKGHSVQLEWLSLLQLPVRKRVA